METFFRLIAYLVVTMISAILVYGFVMLVRDIVIFIRKRK